MPIRLAVVACLSINVAFSCAANAHGATIGYVEGAEPTPSYQHVGADEFQNNPTANSGSGGIIRVGKFNHGLPGNPGTPGNIRGFLGFELIDIPAGATINSVSLTLHIESTEGAAMEAQLRLVDTTKVIQEGTGVYPVGPDDGVTWQQAGAGAPWSTSGGDFFPTPVLASAAGVSEMTFLNGGLIGAAQTALDSGIPLQVILMADDAEAGGGFRGLYFYSDDAANPALRPRLEVTFTPVPEPASIALLGCGIGLIVLARTRVSARTLH